MNRSAAEVRQEGHELALVVAAAMLAAPGGVAHATSRAGGAVVSAEPIDQFSLNHSIQRTAVQKVREA